MLWLSLEACASLEARANGILKGVLDIKRANTLLVNTDLMYAVPLVWRIRNVWSVCVLWYFE